MSGEEAARLRALPYDEYLATDHWRALRLVVIEAADGRCQSCFTRALSLDVHHRTYARIGQELPGDCAVLCRPCHEEFHRTTQEHREEMLGIGAAVRSLTDVFRVNNDYWAGPMIGPPDDEATLRDVAGGEGQ